jgi:cell fate regulator YaaT (PSP1 superfamily)
MAQVVGIRFRNTGKTYYFDPNGADIQVGTGVIVETAQGVEYGNVSVRTKLIPEDQVVAPLKKILRVATPQDDKKLTENRQKEAKALSIAESKAEAHKLDMKFVRVEYTFDCAKAVFYFTSDGRVDFRELVKELASTFRTRIELRQIGVRDETKMLGGLGPCGQPCCCSRFLGGFQPVSIKMAKEQGLSLNPTKISGLCGRLMCCLKYEQHHYEATHKKLPPVGAEVKTPDGVGKVQDVNVFKESVRVTVTNGDQIELKEYYYKNVRVLKMPKRSNIKEEDDESIKNLED